MGGAVAHAGSAFNGGDGKRWWHQLYDDPTSSLPRLRTPVTVQLDTTSLQATLAYQVSRSSAGVITITSAGDLSVPANLTALDNALTTGTLVKVYGVPVASSGNGMFKAYVLFYYPSGNGVVLPTQ